ncbi:uncharacterized protein LOC115444698 [Manduca sexta]|nr:uncharacterized protein LOC115444698 [Manduca sexta]XP_037298150.1 uncharacterized protein LOC115444698 [Manduca sexta]
MQVVPNMGQSPMHRVVSPMAHSMHDGASPMGQQMIGGTSPMAQSMHGCASPMAQPMQGVASPMAHSMHGAGSPNMVQHIDYSQMEGGSFSAELARAEVPALSSGELLGLSALLADRGADLQLSSDLTRLSTSDMLL